MVMNIAIIDSGVDRTHERLRQCFISGICLEYNGSNQLLYTEQYSDSIGHGTAIASIIHKQIPSAKLYAVKIFKDTLMANEAFLIEGIKWCLCNNISIINLSLGILRDNPSQELSKICLDAYNSNIILIAATHFDSKQISYPAGYPYVISVNSGNCNKSNDYGIVAATNKDIDFLAKGSIQRVAWKNNSFNIVSGTSYACAHFTGIVAKYLSNNNVSNIKELKEKLIIEANADVTCLQHSSKSNINSIPLIQPQNMDKIGRNLFTNDKIAWVKRFSLFPSSEKEMSSLITLLELRKNSLKHCIDYPRSLSKANKSVTTNMEKQEWNNTDTLLIGYFNDHPFEANVRFGYNLVNQALKHNKNFFVFDKQIYDYLINNKPYSYSGHIYSPIVNSELYHQIMKFSYLPNMKVPVVAVIGTTNRQGKFTVQTRLKDEFEQQGYTVSLLTTEPHGDILGSSFSFPYGFLSTVTIHRQYWQPCLKTIMKGIQHYDEPHIIFTGTQGGLLPFNNASIGNETCSLDFLLGVEPDALVCVINPQDSICEIENTIKLSKYYSKADVLFYALTPWERNYRIVENRTYANHHFLNEVEYAEKRSFFETQLNKKVVNIMDQSDLQYSFQIIQTFFS